MADPTYTEYVTKSASRTARAIRALGLSCRYRDKEWRVALKGVSDPEASAYYTSDHTDALATAHKMVSALR